eukprot:TRINITY_DN50807_c0_g1_i1.p1 TRINITY_DN50807_c0_g1~~TRINITY_DN50807_c0_g1_i1.p1  ORF type:complete len:213 (-),score=41.82 TRINITY_DN50807_c0_g1_i1:70-708(-)
MIVRSPSFAPHERPFLLENFFDVPEYEDPHEEKPSDDAAALDEFESMEQDRPISQADRIIHNSIKKHFRPEEPSTFVHNGQEWLARAEGQGTRNRSTARAVLLRGSGLVKVNGEGDIYSKWPFFYHRFDIIQPFKLTGTACVYDVFLEVAGGGGSGQAGAARLAIARALFQANPACHDDLQKGFCLMEDTRQKMSEMPGKKGARASFGWNKR